MDRDHGLRALHNIRGAFHTGNAARSMKPDVHGLHRARICKTAKTAQDSYETDGPVWANSTNKTVRQIFDQKLILTGRAG